MKDKKFYKKDFYVTNKTDLYFERKLVCFQSELLFIQKEQERVVSEIHSFKGNPLDLENLNIELDFLKRREILLKEMDSTKTSKVLSSGKRHIGGEFYLFSKVGLEMSTSRFKSYKEELLSGKYDKAFENNISFNHFLEILISRFGLGSIPSDKRVLEFLISYAFFYVNKRKSEGFISVRISKLFDMSSFFSPNTSIYDSWLCKDIKLSSEKFFNYFPEEFEFKVNLEISFFEKLIISYKKNFLDLFKQGSLELYKVYFLWFIFTSLILLREYSMSACEIYRKLKEVGIVGSEYEIHKAYKIFFRYFFLVFFLT